MRSSVVARSNGLGRTRPSSAEQARRLLGCEDEDMYHRLLAQGARGLYVPELVIFHHVPAARLSKRYFRRWCFWRGVSLGVIDRHRPATVPYLLGVPRYQVGRAARGVKRMLGDSVGLTHRSAADRFADELSCWDLAGFFWGKHAHRRGSRGASLDES